jgi:hypothetical protein
MRRGWHFRKGNQSLLFLDIQVVDGVPESGQISVYVQSTGVRGERTGSKVVPRKLLPLKSWKVTSPTVKSRFEGFVIPTIGSRFTSAEELEKENVK